MEVNVKEEPEETKPYVSTLDIKKENTSTWLVKVPQWLAELWVCKVPDIALGKVQLKADPNNAKNNEAYLFLHEDFVGDVPCKHFKMKMAPISKPMKILSEDIQGNVVVEGTVKNKFDLEPMEKMKLRDSMISYAARHDVRNKNNELPRVKVLESNGRRKSFFF